MKNKNNQETPQESFNRYLWKQDIVICQFEIYSRFDPATKAMKKALRDVGEDTK